MLKIRVAVVSILASVAVGVPDAGEGITGFSTATAPVLLDLESQYDADLNPDDLRKWMRHMTERPHHAGSPKAKANAEYIADLFREWGFDVEIEVFHVLYPTPKSRALKQLKPFPFTATLKETIIATDSAATSLAREALPPFNAYSADGDVTGELVYVNQGLPRDYEVLERKGIEVAGKIVIARYGGSWRGIKPKVAAEHGAIGCIIYNDPLADGYARGGAYPSGAFKHESAVQRGSVLDMPKRPGDPLTPNYGATKDAARVSIEESGTVMTIPVLPISSADAEPIMRTLDGPAAPPDWRGALPVTYRLGGGGGSIVKLSVSFNWDLTPAYNVIAKLEGAIHPDEWVIRGNHHDAWVIGARDPMSGLVPLMAQAKAFGALAKTGWRPKRTAVFAVWDAEEPGLLGSTEWVEHHRDELDAKAVAYINTDGNSRGFLSMGGSHTLQTMASEVAYAVPDPQTGVSVGERLHARRLVEGTPDQKKRARKSDALRISALGSGSDYSPFLQHLGIASFNIGFGGEGVGGEYHTCFDTFDHYSKYIDPEFEYGVALAKVCGRLSLRLLESEVLPWDLAAASQMYSEYVDSVVDAADTLREETEEFNRLLRDGQVKLAADPSAVFFAPDAKSPVPHLNFAPLLNARDRLGELANNISAKAGSALSEDQQKTLNRLLYQSERLLIDDRGLPGRPWFRHQIYAPGFYTGYGVKTLPGVREAIEERRWEEAEEQIVRTAAAIDRFADTVESVNTILSNGEVVDE
jgi:N-acetylated-alpha-linked acidic dipeptidase